MSSTAATHLQSGRYPTRPDVPQDVSRRLASGHGCAPERPLLYARDQLVRERVRPHHYGRLNLGLLGNIGQANYGAAKLGIAGLSRIVAMENTSKNGVSK